MKMDRIPRLTKKLTCNKGLSVIELMITLVILLIVLSLGYTFYSFGIKTFRGGEIQSDIQQNARMAAEQITRELRIAEEISIFDNLAGFPGADYDYYMFYLDDNAIRHKAVEVEVENGVVSETTLSDIALLDSIADKVDYDISFSKSSKASNILNFIITVTDQDSGNSFQLETEVLILNARNIEDNTTNDSRTAIFYQVPAPPGPSILGMSIEPSSIEEGENVPNDELKVEVYTYRIDDNTNIRAIIAFDPEKEKTEEVDDNYAKFTFNIPGDLDVDSYRIDVYIQEYGLVYSRLFEVVEPPPPESSED